MSTPLVSVIMPNHNGGEYVKAALRSVQSQGIPDFEVLVVDDASSDNSVSIVGRLRTEDERIKLVTLGSRSGPARARNCAIELARGRYVAFLDSDDIWGEEKLKLQIGLHEAQGCALTFTGFRKIDETGSAVSGVIPVPATVDYGALLNSNYIACSSAIYDTARCGKRFMPDIVRRQDYGLWLSLLKRGGFAHSLPEPLLHYRVHARSLSANKLKSAFYHWRVLRDVEHLPLGAAVRHFGNYVRISGAKFLR